MDRRVFLALGAAGVLGAGGWWLMAPRGPQTVLPGVADAQTPANGAAPDFERVPDMVRGDPDAPVEVIEYASLTCPHCANFHRNVYPQLVENYIEPGLVRFIHREVYFDRYGLWAAMLARCGSESRYFPMLDMIYSTQSDWAGSSDPAQVAENLRAMGRRSGLSNDQVDACLQDAEQAQAMVAVYQHYASEHQINSTPSFVIDGERHGNMSYDDFAALLDGKLGG
ncbi:DsbA family protein [Alkalilacustris brevis]|uniref:DsbA family protein n=1 Tax=Alkalilacustris brevis TaxID=2026338 RepID=UPI000E0D6B9A|nr:DsbA family protein [Alkalilacustris brevis]